MGQNVARQGNPNPDNQSTEKPGIAAIFSLAYVAVQLCSALLGHYDKLTASFGVIGGAVIVALVSIVLMWRKKWIKTVAVFSLVWAVIATGALVYIGNRFVETIPITVSGTIVSNDQGIPIFACVEIIDKNKNLVISNRESAKETGVFSVYNVPSGKYRLVVNGKWVSNFTVPEGYGKLFLTGFSGQMDLEPEPVDVNTATANPDESVPFGNPDLAQTIQNSCGETATGGTLASSGTS